MTENNDDITPPQEGAFDAQLSFSVPFVEAPTPIEWIVKRDGRQEKFEQRKIADAIFKAVKASGGDDRDRADSLASGVSIYLAKRLNGESPTVDQVHDAVEKVLIEMGHARTAVAYVRYRDRRSRQRALERGGAHAILKELDEAQRQREAVEATTPRPLFVCTSDEQVTGWDRARIVEALTRETRMPEDDARRVAGEVELVVQRANLTTLTAPLIRELVDAKLVELGLERYRARHMRLGVPLFDAEQIICTPNQGEIEGQQDPASTDVALAQRVKREFALATVHSSEVTDAHRRGDIHLHGLSQIDRMQSATHFVEFLKRFGLAIYSGGRYAPPPSSALGLVAQVSRMTSAMQPHFVEGVRWSNFNESLTPALSSESNMERIARNALVQLTAPAHEPPTVVELSWPRANIAACMFALQFAETWGVAMDDGNAFGMPHIDVAIDADALEHADFRGMLECLLESYERRACVTLRFECGEVEAPGRRWRARDLVGGIVTLNLPRIAYQTSGEEAFYNLLAERAQVAFAALIEKRSFLDRLFVYGGIGPHAALAFQYNNKAYADPERARYVTGVTGLNECVKILTGVELHGSEVALACAQRILRRLRHEADVYSGEGRVAVGVGADGSESCARRFARIDLQQYGDAARNTAKYDGITREPAYTPGVSMNGRLVAIEKIRRESALHSEMELQTATAIQIESSEMSVPALLGTIETALHQTECSALRFVCGRQQMDFTGI